ncbi:Regulator of G protein signalling domain and Regulator of G protein signalling superfamily domain and Regulator of G-protein signalling, domain 1-containing protein [Strongyloides ratti]|uniref:Regulator of G protein signalling domain and Regulator of G protein signalling superfamily domain and Regulator of G-protein signalling, domain 1-containing protein n=1 Tax=Strongyloides ratti TaxID=34506 RepID=A0A090KXN3_STRRB|nr:Regulator of G protein signalling domain and Regulator of G protein signalling superfamily domain and Regulator of G-protein signalling, domain 1-containing protein [Strongyloides ratti]CEF60013.1 Regulator of G protein signalling domain and Regulator of G protein signalling superfamily domain and Regulator of G-protein signalling, domain 1-containing protein [Strongyloides ratti]
MWRNYVGGLQCTSNSSKLSSSHTEEASNLSIVEEKEQNNTSSTLESSKNKKTSKNNTSEKLKELDNSDKTTLKKENFQESENLSKLNIPLTTNSKDLSNKTKSKIPISSSIKMNPASNMFEMSNKCERKAPSLPSTEDIEYPRAASWVSGTVKDLLDDKIGKQVFMCFLFECLAEENLIFVDDIKRLKELKNKDERKTLMLELLDRCTTTINVSSKALQLIKKEITKDDPDITCFDLADKEVSKLLENDQFPRFRRSSLYLDFLERLLPKAYALKWSSSFEALLGNQVGRHYFRKFLQSIHAEENLRFWEAVVEFRSVKNKSVAMANLGKNIQQQFLREGTHNEVFLPFGLRQTIEKKIQQKDVDITLFDEAIKHVEQVLKNDPYVRFLQSKEYLDLLEKLK